MTGSRDGLENISGLMAFSFKENGPEFLKIPGGFSGVVCCCRVLLKAGCAKHAA
jgi:hypothetical protein